MVVWTVESLIRGQVVLKINSDLLFRLIFFFFLFLFFFFFVFAILYLVTRNIGFKSENSRAKFK